MRNRTQTPRHVNNDAAKITKNFISNTEEDRSADVARAATELARVKFGRDMTRYHGTGYLPQYTASSTRGSSATAR